MAKLSQEDKVAIKAMKKRYASNRELAKLFGVDESTIRYHLAKENAPDGRKNRPQKAEELKSVIDYWLDQNKPDPGRKHNAKALWIYLVDNYAYDGSYKSVVRCLNRNMPQEKMRPKRRVETPPGIQAQADWGEFKVTINSRLEVLYAFVLTLSFSRAFAVSWSRRMDILSWLSCHNKAFSFLGGIPYVVRIDNLKTGVISGAGPTATLNPIYKAYAKELRFVVDPVRARTPEDKGKVEAKVKLIRFGINPSKQEFSSLKELCAWTESSLIRRFKIMKNPVTGESIFEAWEREVSALKDLPTHFPAPFDCVVARTVSDDCLVSFEGRQYSVPFAFVRRIVEVRGAASSVLIYCGKDLITKHPRGTDKRLLIDPSHYEGASTDTVLAPTPLGRLTKEMLSLWDIPVEKHPIDLYERLVEVRHGL